MAITRTAVNGGAPPSPSLTAIATPAVIDFGASAIRTGRGAQSDLATSTADYDRDDRPDDDRRRHRPEVAPSEREVGVDRHAERDRRRPQQEMHELGAVEIGLVVRAGDGQQHADQRDGDRHVVDERVAMRRLGEGVGDKVSAVLTCPR